MSGIFVGAASGYAPAFSGGGGGINGFSNYTAFTINHTQVASDQADFPVMINLTDDRFRTIANGGHVANANGYDLRPCSDAGLTTAFTFELEQYTASSGQVIMWVKIPSLSSSVDTVIYLGYGKASLSTNASSTATWSNGFIAVYHLGDGTTLSVADATGAYNGTNHSATAFAGKIDGCGKFVAASTQHIYTNYLSVPNYITYSAWVKATSYGSDNPILSRFPGSTFACLWASSAGKLNTFFHTVGPGYVGANALGTAMSTGTWYHVAGVYDSVDGKARAYLNGVLDGTSSGSGGVLTATETGADQGVFIGEVSYLSPTYWDGLIDEARIASVSRTEDWLRTEYNNQNTPGTFMVMGSEV